MARYMERTKIEATFLHTNYVAIQDNAISNNWKLVLQKYGDKEFMLKHGDRDYQSSETLLHLITDKENPSSIVNNVMYARENARSVQDHITKEMWQSLNNFYHTIRNEKNELAILNEDPIEVMDMLQQQCYLFQVRWIIPWIVDRDIIFKTSANDLSGYFRQYIFLLSNSKRSGIRSMKMPMFYLSGMFYTLCPAMNCLVKHIAEI